MNIFDLAQIANIFVFWTAKAFSDTKRDGFDSYFFDRVAGTWLWFREWWNGDNKSFNPSLLGDFWHFWEKIMAFNLLAGIVLAHRTTLPPWFWAALVPSSSIVFVVLYHSILPTKRQPVWQSILRVIAFWKNWHNTPPVLRDAKLFRIDDSDWWIAKSEADAVKAYCEMTSATPEQVDIVEEKRIDVLKYVGDDSIGETSTFREKLRQIPKIKEPVFFASTEY